MLKNISFLIISLLIFSASNSYAEKEYTLTAKGCVDPGGTDNIYMFCVDGNYNNSYELADEEIDEKTFTKIWDLCNCNYNKICRATFIYTTDKNDYRDKGAKGLIRKFNSITTD